MRTFAGFISEKRGGNEGSFDKCWAYEPYWMLVWGNANVSWSRRSCRAVQVWSKNRRKGGFFIMIMTTAAIISLSTAIGFIIGFIVSYLLHSGIFSIEKFGRFFDGK